MITYFDLIKRDDFRHFVFQRMGNSIGKPYMVPGNFPKLYKYRPLSEYSIDDIINKKITLTAIGEFNDIFDGAIHQHGTDEEREKDAEEEWKKFDSLRIAANLPEGILSKDYFINIHKRTLKNKSRLKFRESDCLGTYVMCFSEDNSSTLMWSHYADSNKGICIEYDFNSLPREEIIRQLLFPVAYTETPINVNDLLSENGRTICEFPHDAAALCNILNKANTWAYEKEWRIVMDLASPQTRDELPRISFNFPANPSKIILGYHFLKPFFCYDSRNEEENKKCKKAIDGFKKLIAFLKENNISVAIMFPTIGKYNLKPFTIPVDELEMFIGRRFKYDNISPVKYYYSAHDNMMDAFERYLRSNS